MQVTRNFSAIRQTPVWLALVVAFVGCARPELEITGQRNGAEAERVQRTLQAAAALAAAQPRSLQAYARFVGKVAVLRPRFDAAVAAEAELRLVFLAVGPLAAYDGAAAATRVVELSATLWPTVLGIPRGQGEAPHDYVNRLCRDELVRGCKGQTLERSSLTIGAMAWRRLDERAEAAYDKCVSCAWDRDYLGALDTIGRYHTASGTAAKLGRSDTGAQVTAPPDMLAL